VVNYGAYDEATFAEINVTSPAHPCHPELLEILRNPILRTHITENTKLLFVIAPHNPSYFNPKQNSRPFSATCEAVPKNGLVKRGFSP